MINFRNAEFAHIAAREDQFLEDGLPQVVFSGKSNVGKSSLINLLTGQNKLARVSSSPGKTRQILYYLIDRRFYFVDVPGYGFAKAGKQQKAQFAGLTDQYLRSNQTICLILLLLDIRHEPSEQDLMMIDWLAQSDYPHAYVLTKCDKLSRNQIHSQVAKLKKRLPGHAAEDFVPMLTSASKRLGIEELRGAIASVFDTSASAVD